MSHFLALGKGEVDSSILSSSTIPSPAFLRFPQFKAIGAAPRNTGTFREFTRQTLGERWVAFSTCSRARIGQQQEGRER